MASRFRKQFESASHDSSCPAIQVPTFISVFAQNPGAARGFSNHPGLCCSDAAFPDLRMQPVLSSCSPERMIFVQCTTPQFQGCAQWTWIPSRLLNRWRRGSRCAIPPLPLELDEEMKAHVADPKKKPRAEQMYVTQRSGSAYRGMQSGRCGVLQSCKALQHMQALKILKAESCAAAAAAPASTPA